MAIGNCCSKINLGVVGAAVLVCFFRLGFLKIYFSYDQI